MQDIQNFSCFSCFIERSCYSALITSNKTQDGGGFEIHCKRCESGEGAHCGLHCIFQMEIYVFLFKNKEKVHFLFAASST